LNTSLFRPSASSVIYGNHDADGILFENIDKALTVPESDLRLFGEPTSFKRRRMGIALASADNVNVARSGA
jgi:phosphoribosylglycinamide formyltransferase 2